jgi:hypothetical protein
MNEVGGPTARYLPRLKRGDDVQAWAANAAQVLNAVLALSPLQTQQLRKQCAAWPARFRTDAAIDGYLHIYQQVLAAGQGPSTPTPEKP